MTLLSSSSSSSSGTGSSSSTSTQGIFKSYPQKYPKAQQTARKTAELLVKAMQKGPQSQIAEIVDTSFHASQGYVICTTNHAIVRVVGVPYGSVVPHMRIFVRQLGSYKTNQSYIFDGFAPNVSTLGNQGSVLVNGVSSSSLTSGVLQSGIGGIPSSSLLSGAIGYYWHLFFYLPQLPTSVMTLFQMTQTSSGGLGGLGSTLQLEYTPSGFLQFRSFDNQGYITQSPIPPHRVHWVLIQPGNPGNEFLVDNVSAYTGLASPTSEPTFSGQGATYTFSFGSTASGTQLLPIGSFLSKMGYGCNSQGGSILPLFVDDTPIADSELPLFTLSPTQQTFALYLCKDTPGSVTLANAVSGAALSTQLTLNPQILSLQLPGPY